VNQVDDISEFGTYHPNPVINALTKLGQSCPQSWFGKQFGQLVSKVVRAMVRNPLDTTVGKIRMRFYLSGNNSERKFLLTPWRFDQDERKFISKVLRSDGVFVDIGANVGIYSLWAMSLLGSQGRVISFEPNPLVFRRLNFNVGLNLRQGGDSPQVNLFQVGIGDHEGELPLYLDRRNLGGSSILPISDKVADHKIACKPLFSVLKDLGISHIDILKIDIEGAEPIALSPFFKAATINLYPHYILIENSEKRWDVDFPDQLRKWGYTVELKAKNNTIYRLDRPQSGFTELPK